MNSQSIAHDLTADDFWRQVSDPGRPPVFLPDIGTFFNQDIELARDLVQQVAGCGVRFLKGEILHDADICLRTDVCERYLGHDARPVSENYRQLIERKVVSLAHYARVFEASAAAGIGIALSVYDAAGADFARDIGACALKVASTNLVHAPLIRHAARSGLPLILDTGKATLDEVARSVRWAREAGAERLIVEYSPPAPPAPVEGHNLRVFELLGAAFDCPLGLSDHHAGEEMLYAASALGCRVLEKGVCPDHMDADQDVFHALPVGQLADVVRKCNSIFAAMGDSRAAYAPPPERPAARMGLVTAAAVRAGERLTLDSVRFAFPTLGVPVEEWDRVVGRRFASDLAANTPIGWEHVSTDGP